MFTVYVLHSPDHEKIYIGFNSDLDSRMLSHNELGTKGWTIHYRPWEVVYTEKHRRRHGLTVTQIHESFGNFTDLKVQKL